MIFPSFITKLIFRNDSTTFHWIGGHWNDLPAPARGPRPPVLAGVHEARPSPPRPKPRRQWPPARAGAGSDRGAFPAAGDGADKGAEGSSTACIFGGSPVRAKPLLAAFSQIAGTNEVLLTLYRNRLQVQHEIGGAVKASSFRSRPDNDLSVRTMRNDHIAVGVENVVGDFGRIGLSFDGSG